MLNFDDYKVYKELVEYTKLSGEYPVYTIGEEGNMIHYFNEEADTSFFQKLADDFTITNVRQRRS
jgi:hypothetical protein